jgi:eukaryotic-like serine/threonine-protein kinase
MHRRDDEVTQRGVGDVAGTRQGAFGADVTTAPVVTRAAALPVTRDSATEIAAAHEEPERANELIGGRYELVRRVGSGGMGAVYLARDRVRGDAVAVKILSEARPAARFARECAILASLRHERVVRYRDHGVTESGSPWLVMDWLAGSDLAARLAQSPLHLAEGLRVLRDTAEALAAVHDVGIVHRDVKPSNLFLVDGALDRVKLIDFGIARAPGSSVITFNGEFLGTPGYVAPEQVDNSSPATAGSDVFSLGCTVWACFTGASPFRGSNALSALSLLFSNRVPSLREARPDVPVAIDALVSAMIHRDPAKRPADGRAVLDALGPIA